MQLFRTVRDYQLHKGDAVNESKQCRIVPPQPGKGERSPRPYSPDDLDALMATSRAFPACCLVSIKASPANPIVTWEKLFILLCKAKRRLENLRRAHRLPPCIFVTEFDPIEREGRTIDAAAFHIGFSKELTGQQQISLRDWWLELIGLENNQGRYFQYDAKGGSKDLQDYIAKDIDFREKQERFVKFPVSWLPSRVECRLWFVIGAGRRKPAAQGRALRAQEGKKRKRYKGAHGHRPFTDPRVSTVQAEGEHGPHPITCELPPVACEPSEAVTTQASSAVSAQVIRPQSTGPVIRDGYQAIDINGHLHCGKCWHSRGRSLWFNSCICTGDVC